MPTRHPLHRAQPVSSRSSRQGVGLNPQEQQRTRLTLLCWQALGIGVLWWACTSLAQAQDATAAAAPAKNTRIEALVSNSQLTQNLPSGRAVNLRGSWAMSQDTVLNAEWLSERKFDATGGVVAVGATQTVNREMFVSGTYTGGWGGPNWARSRVDATASYKWGADQKWVTTLGGYYARFDAGRSDRGLKVSANYYLNRFAVFEVGSTFNRSNPGSRPSTMPYAAVTLGQEGLQVLSVRVSRGNEAYQSLGAASQLVDFDSQTYGLDWRHWINPDWGVLLHAEHYRNPSYHRNTVGGGVFVQM